MKKKSDPLEKAFRQISCDTALSQVEKDEILRNVLMEAKNQQEEPSPLYRLFSIYPWRIALGLSVLQACVLTLMFGTQYTNIILRVFGG